MTKTAYLRLLTHVHSVRRSFDPFLSRLPQEAHERIWKAVSDGVLPARDYEEFLDGTARAKANLLEYVLKNGPFVFVDQRCFLIDVTQFNADEWQSATVPAADVTACAQNAFLPESRLYPERVLPTKIAVGIIVILVLLIAWWSSRC